MTLWTYESSARNKLLSAEEDKEKHYKGKIRGGKKKEKKKRTSNRCCADFILEQRIGVMVTQKLATWLWHQSELECRQSSNGNDGLLPSTPPRPHPRVLRGGSGTVGACTWTCLWGERWQVSSGGHETRGHTQLPRNLWRILTRVLKINYRWQAGCLRQLPVIKINWPRFTSLSNSMSSDLLTNK